MRTATLQRSILPFAAGTSLALAFAFELAEFLPSPFAWHFVMAMLLFILAIALQRSFLQGLDAGRRRNHKVAAGCVLDASLAMFVWALASLSLVRGICALLSK